MAGEKNLNTLLQNMAPTLQPGFFVFCTLQVETIPTGLPIIASFREQEGLSVVVQQSVAERAGWTYASRMAWITLNVHSALEAVGLTAAVAQALAKENISCNVIAAYYHDHLFVPSDQAEDAMTALRQLSATT